MSKSVWTRMAALFACFAAFLAAPAPAQPVKADPAFETRVRELVPVLSGKADLAAFFSPGFLAAVPPEKFAALNKQLGAANGAVTGIESIEAVTPFSGIVRVGFERAIATMRIAVDPQAPHRVTGLVITGMSARETSLEEVAAALKALPGSVGFVLTPLDGSAPVLSHNPDQLFAIGSEFKLVILAELVRAVTAGERHWDEEIVLDGKPLPGGAYAQRAAGTKVKLRELAEKMISVSDNSATDLLLAALGREKVEAMLEVVGWSHPERSRPFLGALDMFKLKGIGSGALAQRWLALDEAGRRAMLEGEIGPAPLSSISPTLFLDGKPVLVDRIEWFASPMDMVRTMDWLRRNTESGPAAEARAILARNSGVGASAASGWAYVGYKGGSEPGVIAMTLLLQDRQGGWHALSAKWNKPDAPVDETRFATLIARAVELAGSR